VKTVEPMQAHESIWRDIQSLPEGSLESTPVHTDRGRQFQYTKRLSETSNMGNRSAARLVTLPGARVVANRVVAQHQSGSGIQ
jgi:hypothetical protein